MSGLQPRKIVVPVDFSDFSFAALDRAVEIAGPGASIEVIHVLGSLSAMEPGNMYGTITDETRAASVVKNLSERFSDDKYSAVTCHAFVGDAGHEITKFADQQEADLIVIPSHGYGFFKHLMIGSVAERVIRLAHCPVLVLRSPADQP